MRLYTLRWVTFALQSAGEPAVTSITLAGKDSTGARLDTVLQPDANKKGRIASNLTTALKGLGAVRRARSGHPAFL